MKDCKSNYFAEYLLMVGSIDTTNRPEVFRKKSVLKNFGEFHRKTPVPESLFNKVADLRPIPATLLEKRLWHRCFPVDFAKFLRTPFSKEHLHGGF